MQFKNRIGLIIGFILIFVTSINAQIKRIDPTHWWVGMANPNLQLLVYGENIGSSEVLLKKYKGVHILGVQKVENSNYLFIYLEIKAKAKRRTIEFYFYK